VRIDPFILIVGAGPTGLGAAWRLHELGHERWQVVEASDAVGGLAASVVDAEGFTWDLGGHVLFSHYEYFDRLLDALLGDARVEHVRESWVWMRERFIPYPLQNNVWRLPKPDLLRCLEGLLAVRGADGGRPARNFDEWLVARFGDGLADVFMRPYNRKVWAYPPATLDVGWMGDRVALVDLARVLRGVILEEDDLGWGPNATFRYPLRGGTGAIWTALARRLPAGRILTGRSVVEVRTRDREAVLDDGQRLRFDRLITTMPLDLLLPRLVDRPDLAAAAPSFRHSSTHVVGIGLDGHPGAALKTKCWIYFPEPEVPFYRVTVFSNYSPHNVPRPGQQWSLLCEVSESPVTPPAVDAPRAVLDGLQRVGLVAVGTVPRSVWHRRLEHGYPTPFLGRDDILVPLDRALRASGIWSRGRFGAWKYETSNQDHALMQGVEAVDHLLRGTEEVTYHDPQRVNRR
jgi:protoporphyrinogen oxidase